MFDTIPDGTANHDTITDFNGVQDRIRPAKSVFTALTGNVGAKLSADQFVVGPSAQDANDGQRRWAQICCCASSGGDSIAPWIN